MTSFQKTVESYSRVKVALVDLLKEHSPNVSELPNGDFPLLILETKNDTVGFATLNDDLQQTYSLAYNSFKKIYRENHITWKERNLSFVICRADLTSSSDSFFSQIESDFYFCRKYVIRLCQNFDELKQELLRLPFLPLPEGYSGGIMRPPSAQTFLQSSNINAQLARQLIVPQESSAKRIVEQLMAGIETMPPVVKFLGSEVLHELQPTEHKRIKSLEIESFRSYRKKQKFDLDADVVVLYGQNGLGKTSFFDAIDYVCTGRIGRLCNRSISQSDFIHFARHLSSPENLGYVKMEVLQDENVHSIKRMIDDWGNALIDDTANDRKRTLQFLTSANWETTKTRVENVEHLFRATHLFGQSDPELLMEFEKNSTLSHDLVHRMLALDDYASGLAKSSGVIDYLESLVSGFNNQIDELDIHINTLKSQIDEIPKSIDTISADAQLKEIALRLVNEIVEKIEINIDNSTPTQTSAREWRAITESALKESQDELNNYQYVAANFIEFSGKESLLKRIIDELKIVETEYHLKESTEESLQERLNTLSNKLNQEKASLLKANKRISALLEITDLQNNYQILMSSLQKWHEDQKINAALEKETSENLQALRVSKDNCILQATDLRETIHKNIQRLNMFREVHDSLPTWISSRDNIITLQQTILNRKEALKTANDSADQLRTVISAMEFDLASYDQEYRELTVNQAEMTRLLDEIEVHVENGICPICGVDHKTKIALLKRINDQKQTRPFYVDNLTKLICELRKNLSEKKSILEGAMIEYLATQKELGELTLRLNEVLAFVDQFELNVNVIGLKIDEQLEMNLMQQIMSITADNKSLNEQLLNLELEITHDSNEISKLEQKRIQQNEYQKHTIVEIQQLEQQKSALYFRADALGLSLELSQEELLAETNVAKDRKAKAEQSIQDINPQTEILKQNIVELQGEKMNLNLKIKNLVQDRLNLEESVQQFKERVALLNDKSLLSIDLINTRKKLAEDRVNDLSELRRKCINLERIVDETHRSTILADLEAQVQSVSKKKEDYLKNINQTSLIKKWVSNVKDALQTLSSNAIAHHIEAFGPLSTLIQKRLRAVYGFGDVRLSTKGNEIRVEVGWDTIHVKPADYFSDSQKQILMLSIFMANRLTQTWSGFSPILMDDPVTHFDDLNAFGFVELIRGLVSTSPGKRQFFISTCEDRLFDLMLKKFANIPGGAKFYRLEGIGRDGPDVVNIH
jgi:DNA repair protein SbcC/Rad50